MQCTRSCLRELQRPRLRSTAGRSKQSSFRQCRQSRPDKDSSPPYETKTVLPITCVHGDTRELPVRRVTISAVLGSWPIEVGLVKDLPVTVLLGRDWEDERLKQCWTQTCVVDGKDTRPKPHPLPHFVVENGLLYCVAQRRGEERKLLVIYYIYVYIRNTTTTIITTFVENNYTIR